MAPVRVYCIRHGQTMENARGIIQGQMDTQLDETGVQQAASVAHSLKDITFDVAYTSDLTRAVDTATAILQHHPELELRKTVLLRERYMGNLQGQPAWPKQSRPPMDDSVEGSMRFMERALQFWDQLIVPHVKRMTVRSQPECSSNVLVVSHGAFISTLTRALIGYREVVKAADVALQWCPNTSITLFEIQADGRGAVLSFGSVAHLVKPVMEGRSADELPV